MTWVLVFWLMKPDNFTQYARYTTESECNRYAHIWNERLNKVQSKLIAECRRYDGN